MLCFFCVLVFIDKMAGRISLSSDGWLCVLASYPDCAQPASPCCGDLVEVQLVVSLTGKPHPPVLLPLPCLAVLAFWRVRLWPYRSSSVEAECCLLSLRMIHKDATLWGLVQVYK